MHNRSKLLLSLLLFASLALPLSALSGAHTAAAAADGGSIAGTVTDPRGAVVVGATVTVYTEAGGQPAGAAKTDAKGQYRIENLPPGTYNVVVEAGGFNAARVEKQSVEEGKAAKVDVRLEVAGVETQVEVKAGGMKANEDAVYRQLRTLSDSPQTFAGEYATVSGLVLRRDAATFTLHSGEVYFLPPVEGRVTGAVFVGDGEFTLTPPVEYEKRSLSLFTGQPSITEQFTKLTLRFTDKTYEEIKASPQAKMATSGPQSSRARDIFRDNQELLREKLRTNMELRTLVDIYTPQRPGFLVAFIGGKRFEKLVYQIDPLGIPEVSPEEELLSSYGDTDGGFWTAFHISDEYASGTASNDEDHRIFDITRHEMDCAIKGTQIAATDAVSFRALVPGTRVIPFSLYGSLRVGRVRDSEGRDLNFIQEKKDKDADFALIWPEQLETNREYKVTIEYAGGDALSDLGGGNYYLGPRETWYPNNSGTQFGDRAVFDMTFRYPKGKTLIGTGELAAPESRDGDYAVAHWTSGDKELAVAGFNYGVFKKKIVQDAETGYQIEFYANEDLPNFMEGVGVGSMSTTGMADSAIADAENATRIYDAYFGKLPYTRVAMTQQPASNFGQAWPTLVYMPFTAFMDSTQRWLATGSARFAGSSFWHYVGPHEVAHQWWGHSVGWKSYRDQWMSEGFAEFSTSLYAQFVRKDMTKFTDFWEDQRQLIIQSRPETKGRKPYEVGPVTQGYRLNSGKTGNVARFMIYPKGAYILHMLRTMMHDRKTGDERFIEMMKDFVQTNFNRDVSTEDFKHAVERHMTPIMNFDGNGRMDWFFDEWVYGTEIPRYKFEYSFDGGLLTGRVTQSGVSDNFKMLVPVYIDMGEGWFRLGQAPLQGNASVELGKIKLPQAPKRVAICALKDVLALDIENGKK